VNARHVSLRVLLCAAALTALAVAGPARVGGQDASPPGATRSALKELTSLADLQALFNAERGTHRLVVLLSPT
jgi:hypothetical protein